MGTILASTIIARAQEVAQDEDGVTFTDTQGLSWLNEGQLAVCLVKADAKTVNRSMQLTAGTTKQAIAGRELLAVIRNMGDDGTTPGRAIRLVDRGAKDEANPDWHTETPATAIKEYMFDDRDDGAFYVSPPAHGSTAVYVEVLEAINPTDVADAGDAIDLDDIYAPALVEWICGRWFGRDSEETPNSVRADKHYRQFYNILGVKMQNQTLNSPKTRAHLE